MIADKSTGKGGGDTGSLFCACSSLIDLVRELTLENLRKAGRKKAEKTLRTGENPTSLSFAGGGLGRSQG